MVENKMNLKIIFLTLLALVVNMVSINQAGAQSLPAVIKVGTMGTFEPFSYVDENDVLTGYDIEILKEISKRDPQLKFEFVASPWDTLFPGLDADKFQVLANQITTNPDRVKKYIFTKNQYFVGVNTIIVKDDREDIKSLFDLKGNKIGMTIGDNRTLELEKWNNENGNILEITYFENDLPGILVDLVNGRIDATFNDPLVAVDKAKRQGLKIKSVSQRYNPAPIYYVFKKDATGELLKKRIDAGLKALIAEGWLSKKSIELFGVDYSK
jgi:L-cystine transport system substrate-binding protein